MAERQAIYRGTFTSVKDLNAKIRAYIDGWNNRAHPFTWTKTAEQILRKANRKKISNAEHYLGGFNRPTRAGTPSRTAGPARGSRALGRWSAPARPPRRSGSSCRIPLPGNGPRAPRGRRARA